MAVKVVIIVTEQSNQNKKYIILSSIVLDKVNPVYIIINKKCLQDIKKCKSPSEREKAIPINKVLNRLIDKCNKTKMAEEDYMRKITPIIENLEQTGQ